jgi:hypothetical protein
MNCQKLRKAYTILIILIGVTINVVYAIELLGELFAPQTTNSVHEILISAITLQFGWAAMLFWVAFDPFERRHILLFTALPMVIGNLLFSINQFVNTDVEITEIVLNLTVGIFVAGMFVLAFFLGNPGYFLLEEKRK